MPHSSSEKAPNHVILLFDYGRISESHVLYHSGLNCYFLSFTLDLYGVYCYLIFTLDLYNV